MKDGWKLATVGDVCTYRPQRNGCADLKAESEVTFLPMEDLKAGAPHTEPRQTRPLQAVAKGYTYFQDGDLLLAKITPCFQNGKLAIAQGLTNGVGFGSTEYIVLRPGGEVSPKYVYYFLSRQEFRDGGVARMGGAVGQQRVPVEYVLTQHLPLPPLPEQQRIVAILDEAFAAIEQARANTEKNLQNARELFESYLNQMLTEKAEGWVEKRLGDVCTISSSLIDPRAPEQQHLRHVGAGNMEAETGALHSLMTAQQEGLISAKFAFDETAVLYSKIRPYLKKVARPSFAGLCSADVYPLVPGEKVTRDFLFYLLLTTDFTEYAIRGSARAGMPKVNRPHLFDYRAWLPAVATQQIICERLDQVSTESQGLQACYRRKLAALDNLRKSLLHQAFNGEM